MKICLVKWLHTSLVVIDLVDMPNFLNSVAMRCWKVERWNVLVFVFRVNLYDYQAIRRVYAHTSDTAHTLLHVSPAQHRYTASSVQCLSLIVSKHHYLCLTHTFSLSSAGIASQHTRPHQKVSSYLDKCMDTWL